MSLLSIEKQRKGSGDHENYEQRYFNKSTMHVLNCYKKPNSTLLVPNLVTNAHTHSHRVTTVPLTHVPGLIMHNVTVSCVLSYYVSRG